MVLDPFQQISRPQNVRVELTPDGHKVQWDPPALGTDILDHYTLRWYQLGKEPLAETVETKHNFVSSKLLRKLEKHNLLISLKHLIKA